MKKIYTIVFLAIAAMAAFSCNKEIKVDGNAAAGPKVVVASTDQDVTPDTKTSLSGVTVLWKSTDAVKAISADGATVTSSRTSVNETGKKAEFTFDGLTVADDILLLAYPAEAVSALEAKANTVTASIPTVQTATPDSFADGANVAVAAGQVEVPVFRNIGGLLSLKVNNEGIASVKLLANEPLTGGSAVISAATPYDVQLTGGAGEVEITGGLENGQTYYAVVYPGSYTGLQIVITDEKGRTATYSNPNTLTVERNANLFIADITVPDAKWEAVTKGATWEYTFTGKAVTAYGDVELAGTTTQTWNITGNGEYFGYDGTKGQQLGSGSKPNTALTLSTNFGSNYGVTDVTINTSGANSIEATVSVSVGGTAFQLDNPTAVLTAADLTNTATDYKFIAPDGQLHTGEILISYAQTSSKAIYVKNITVNADTREQVATPEFSPAAGVVAAGTVVTISTTTSGATIYYTTDGSDPTTSSNQGASVTIDADKTIKAIAVKDGMRDSEVASATYTVGTATGDGTLEHPFNIDGAKGYIDGGGTGEVYVTGIVSSIVKEYNAEYGNAQFWISDSGKTDDFEAYNCYFLENKWWTAANIQIKVGDVVVLCGKLTKFNSTYETKSKEAYLYSLNGATTDAVPTISKTDITGVSADGVTGQTTTVTFSAGSGWTASVEADGSVVTSASIAGGTITYSVGKNTGSARSGSITVKLTNDADNTRVVSAVISVGQLAASSTGGSHAYVKVTSTADITDGDYLIVYEAGNVAFNGGLSSFDAAGNTIAVTIASGSIEANATTNAAKFTIASVTDGYSIKGASGKYIGITSYGNGLKTLESACTNSISIDNDGNAVITVETTGGTMTLRFNKASDQLRFRYFKSGQQAIQLYKYQ